MSLTPPRATTVEVPDQSNGIWLDITAECVSELDVVAHLRADGTTIVGRVDTRSVDPALGVVSFTFFRQARTWPGVVLTVPIGTIMRVQADV